MAMTRFKVMVAGTVLLAMTAVAAHADVVTTEIKGTHTVANANVNATSGNYRPFMIDTSVLFMPTQGPITVTGSVDPSHLSAGSSVFVGLMDKARYNAWVAAGYDPNNTQTSFFGFIDTAYGVFNQQTLLKERFGIGQQKSTADTTQAYPGTNIAEGAITNFSITFNATGISGKYGSTTSNLSYVNHYNYLTGGGTIPTDFSDGAYAFVGTFFNKVGGSVPLDVTFSGSGTVVPLPAAVWMALPVMALMLGVVFLRRRQVTV
jgi:hypothetical protein